MDVVAGLAIVELLFLVVKVWALVAWFRSPSWAWREAGRRRGMWLLLLVVALFLPLVGFALALWFLLSTSPDVNRAAQLGMRPGMPY
jgi:uncharacterized membrane protein YozB (DUF420 family)